MAPETNNQARKSKGGEEIIRYPMYTSLTRQIEKFSRNTVKYYAGLFTPLWRRAMFDPTFAFRNKNKNWEPTFCSRTLANKELTDGTQEKNLSKLCLFSVCRSRFFSGIFSTSVRFLHFSKTVLKYNNFRHDYKKAIVLIVLSGLLLVNFTGYLCVTELSPPALSVHTSAVLWIRIQFGPWIRRWLPNSDPDPVI